MMFEPFKMNWKGREATIPPRRMMGAIAACETHLTMPELEVFQLRQTLPIARIANAYAAVLQYAGIPVASDEVYAAFLEDGAESMRDVCLPVLIELQTLMVPPHLRNKMVEVKPEGQEAGNGAAAPAPQVQAGTGTSKVTSSNSTQRLSSTRKRRG